MARIILIMVIEKFREPSWLTASAVFPLMMTAALYMTDGGSLDKRVFGTLLGYLDFQLCISMVGVYFLGRRESGFLKAFVWQNDSKQKYFFSELLSCLVCGSTLIFVLGVMIGYVYVDQWIEIFRYVARALIVFFFLFPLFSLYNRIPFNYQQVLQGTSVLSAPLLILALWAEGTPEGSAVRAFNLINPVHLASVFINGKGIEGLIFLILVSVCSALTIVCLKSRLSVATYWDR